MAQTLTNLNINDNNAVISALREGDEEVFDHIYRYYFRGLCAFCSQYVTLSESEEIVQDTMMWLWENRKTLIPELTLKTLLFTIVKNKALNKISHFEKNARCIRKLRKNMKRSSLHLTFTWKTNYSDCTKRL